MKTLVIYDSTGKIWLLAHGETEVPQGLTSMFVDIPDGAILERIDVTDAKNPQPVFAYLPETDIGRLQKDMKIVKEQAAELKALVNPSIDMETCTLDELKEWKKGNIHKDCTAVISKGITVKLSDGTKETFRLTEYDQLNLFGKQAQLDRGAARLEYHADGKPCRYYPAEDMRWIIEAAIAYVSYHTTYCNSMNQWIDRAETKEEVQEIFYGADIPESYRSEVLNAYLVKIASMAEASANG